MRYTQRYRRSKLNDSLIRCDLCAKLVWLSEAELMTKEQGYPNMYACPNHKIKISYCLVPPPVIVEEPTKVTRVLPNFDLPNNASDIDNLDPDDYPHV